MDIKKLKGSAQLAALRYKADPSEANKTILDNAVQAFESAQKSESEKIEQISGDSAAEAHAGAQAEGEKQLQAIQDAKTATTKVKASKVVTPSTTAVNDDATGSIPEGTASTGETAATEPEKKTDEQA